MAHIRATGGVRDEFSTEFSGYFNETRLRMRLPAYAAFVHNLFGRFAAFTIAPAKSITIWF